MKEVTTPLEPIKADQKTRLQDNPKQAWHEKPQGSPPAGDEASGMRPVGVADEGPLGDSSKAMATSDIGGCSPDERIPCCKKVIFSAPTVATLPFVAMWGMYGNKSYQAFGAPLAMIGLFTALARSFDVVSDPLVSYWTDSSECGRMPKWLRGRRKPFMFFGCFFYSALLWLLLSPPYWCKWAGDGCDKDAAQRGLSIWFGITYSCFFLSNTLTTIPYDALGPELSQDSDERTGLFFTSNLFDGGGTLIALGLPIMMEKFSADYTDRNEEICKTDTDRANLCLASRSCGDFFWDGWEGAYKPNATLQVFFANMTSIQAPKDPARKCIAWFRSRDMQDSVLGVLASPEQNDGFCHCMESCGDGCDVANKRTGFMLVGTIFAIWFVVTMVTAVCTIQERPLDPNRPKPPPIIPSMRGALSNRPFCILLPAWLCDAFVTALIQSLVPFFVEAVVAPAYQTMEEHGRDCYASSADYEGGKWIGKAGMQDSDNPDRLCNTNNVIAICGLLALVTAIMMLPIWYLIVGKLGKVRAWLLWSLTMAGTNILFIFVGKGGVWFLFIVAAVNGAPLGAKFLADSVLADIIDYDEFLTGTRSEATYFMFKSFLPKIVQIPTAAVPQVLMYSFGYRDPVGGRVQDQPTSVSNYIRFVVGSGFVMSVLAFILKSRYPLIEERVVELNKSLQKHKAGHGAEDPVSRRPYMPMIVNPEEQEVFSIFRHFSTNELRYAFLPSLPRPDQVAPEDRREGKQLDSTKMTIDKDKFDGGCKYLLSLSTRWLVFVSICFVGAAVGTASTLQLLDDKKMAFVPTLFVVAFGISVAANGFCALRLRAALKMQEYPGRDAGGAIAESVKRLILHQVEVDELGKDDAAGCSSLLFFRGSGSQATGAAEKAVSDKAAAEKASAEKAAAEKAASETVAAEKAAEDKTPADEAAAKKAAAPEGTVTEKPAVETERAVGENLQAEKSEQAAVEKKGAKKDVGKETPGEEEAVEDSKKAAADEAREEAAEGDEKKAREEEAEKKAREDAAKEDSIEAEKKARGEEAAKKAT